MSSPAKRHFQRHAAALPIEERAFDRAAANQYELMLAKLAEDRRRLKDVQSMERKADVKRELLPDYLPWIDGVIEGDTGRQDDVLMSVFVWAIDIGDYATAIRIGTYALAHKLTMPDQYKRDVATVLAEEVADQALKAIAAEQAFASVTLMRVAELTEREDMPDEVRAKLHKAIGYTQRAEGNGQAAKEALTRALALHDKVGVKKDIERLETVLKSHRDTDSGAAGTGIINSAGAQEGDG